MPNKNFFNSKFFLVGMVVFLGLSGAGLIREVANTFKIRQEISQLEMQAAQLEAQNKELKTLIEYFNSPVYQERAARESLNLQAAGEVAVALPNNARENQNVEQQNLENSKSNKTAERYNPLLWWEYFFGIENSIK